ncbi:hypothetical protein [Halorussus halophilus]|uniref:hypothetical protein n=1 Tax=Halorussus halophilus TaxID=2650975 RepID=UPI0013014B92|nr:hypothetical protein [Halorussus halophilus]
MNSLEYWTATVEAYYRTFIARRDSQLRLLALSIMGVSLLAVAPASAQSSGTAFCQTNMAGTVRNLFTVIQFGGPLIGGVLTLGATVFMPIVRRADLKKELKEIRNQGFVWGVIVAPLGTSIIQFALNNIVVGGASYSF